MKSTDPGSRGQDAGGRVGGGCVVAGLTGPRRQVGSVGCQGSQGAPDQEKEGQETQQGLLTSAL